MSAGFALTATGCLHRVALMAAVAAGAGKAPIQALSFSIGTQAQSRRGHARCRRGGHVFYRQKHRP